jgi:glycosyltransferase involved in cell wall biosynthesis
MHAGVTTHSGRPIFTGGYGPGLHTEVESYARAVIEVAKSERFDLIHAHDWMTFPAGQALAQDRRRPLVCHVHACEYDRNDEHRDEHVRGLEQQALVTADRVVCVSRSSANTLERHYELDPSKLRVVHNGVEVPDRGSEGPWPRPQAEPTVLFLGRVTRQKDPLAFLEAAARVLAVEPRVTFVLAGSGDLWPRLVERSAELGIASRVRFPGFLEGAEVARMYGAADVFVLPSRSEPFGIAPLEAAARGAAVILTRQSGVAEVLSSALRVDSGDVDGLARQILLLLRRPLLRKNLVRRARGELACLTWDRTAEHLESVFREVAA